MTCYSPVPALYYPDHDLPVHFLSREIGEINRLNNKYYISLPCHRCIGCQLSYSRGWCVRCFHESLQFEHNSFITLTYNEYHYARVNGNLFYNDFQLFLKRLRSAVFRDVQGKRFLTDGARGVRFFMCGEYGSLLRRPHFHALLFNLSFPDLELHSVKNGVNLFTSSTLDSLWSHSTYSDKIGFASVGAVTPASAAYVARYNLKKAFQSSDFKMFNFNTGELLEPEFTEMSTNPGIAGDFIKHYVSSVYSNDSCILPGGKYFQPPRYYDNKLKSLDPDFYELIKEARVIDLPQPTSYDDNSPERLKVRQTCKIAQIQSLTRIL
jgi:hypothetical protein